MFQQVAPCDSSGREYNEADDMFVDSPDELVGKEVNFVFKIVNCRWVKKNISIVYQGLRVFLFQRGANLFCTNS